MEITVLASGSKGNCTVLKTDTLSLLIDAGITYKRMHLLAHAHGVDLQKLDGILLTHEHVDHVRGLAMLLKHTPAMVYTTVGTFSHLVEKTTQMLPIARHCPIQTLVPFTLGELLITPIAVSHDAVDTTGFIIREGDKTLVYMTDVGYLPSDDYPLIENADMYVFEANYDVSLLFSSSRPHYLKQRIDSIRGHMSNTDSAYHLSHLIGPRTKTIVLVHPSEECNTRHHVIETYRAVFHDYQLNLDDYQVVVSEQHQPTPTLIL